MERQAALLRISTGNNTNGKPADRVKLYLIALLCVVVNSGSANTDIINPPQPDGPQNELHIGRLVHLPGPHSGWGPGRPWWRIDWPEAEQHFIGGLKRYTVIDVAADSAHLTLLDEELFDYPWIFAQQVGRWQISDREARRLGEYLSRGGFMVADDLHGPAQWKIFQDVMRRALPGMVVNDISPDDELMHVLYDLKQDTQIPGRRHLVGRRSDGSVVVRMPHSPARWRGIQDDKGRLMVAINYNMDMGDAWEHADDPVYPVPMTTLAYQFGINYLVYAMTH